MTKTTLIFSCSVAFLCSTRAFSSLGISKFRLSHSSSHRLFSETDKETQSLLDEVARIRAEIAALEGKSVEEVESEAQSKRAAEQERLFNLEQSRTEAATERQKDAQRVKVTAGRFLPLPEDAEDQVRQASAAVERAYSDGITRQTVRFALHPYDSGSVLEMSQWPGGAQEMYRKAGRPFTEDLLKQIRAESKHMEEEESPQKSSTRSTSLPPKIITQDIWDFDGSALVTAESSGGPSGDVQAMVLPNTDTKYTEDIRKVDEAMGNRLFLLVNPFWRNIESWGINIMAPNAKSKAQEVIFDKPYEETYVLNRLDARGESCAALRAYPYDWQLYAYIEDEFYPSREVAVWLGSTAEEPTSAQFTELLNARPEFELSKNMRMMQRMMGK